MREALAPGVAARAIDLIVWNRAHGRRKHVAVIAGLIERLGWQVQRTLAKGIPLEETPALTDETLFVLIDDAFVREGSTAGATRSEAEEALRHCEARGTIRKTKTGYVVTTPQPRPKPESPERQLMTAHRPETDASWSIDKYVFALLDGTYKPREVPVAQLPPETRAALKAHLAKSGTKIESTEISCTCLTFYPNAANQREAYYIKAAADDPLQFCGFYLFEGARRIATSEGPSRMDLAPQRGSEHVTATA